VERDTERNDHVIVKRERREEEVVGSHRWMVVVVDRADLLLLAVEADTALQVEKNKIIAVSSRIFFYVWSATQSETITSS
jgi:hypothetical protein